MKVRLRILTALCMLCLAATSVLSGCSRKKAWTATQEQIEQANALAQEQKQELMVGLWVTPPDFMMQTQEDADMRVAEIKESGINMVYTFQETEAETLDWLERLLLAAEHNGVKVMVQTRDLDIVRFTKDFPSVIGYNMFDEPSFGMFGELATSMEDIRAIVGDGKIIMCNLLPNYTRNDILGNQTRDGMTIYQTYLDTFMSTVHSDVISFDNYPYGETNTGTNSLIQNLCDIARFARKYDVPAWAFIQNSGWGGMVAPDLPRLRLLCHIHLLFGVKSYSYFTYWVPNGWGYESMITYQEGERTDMYYRVQQINREVDGMAGRYLDYDFRGVRYFNLAEWLTKAVDPDFLLSAKESAPLQEVTGNKRRGVLVGCFEKDGTKAYYVLNCDTDNDATPVTLHFKGNCDYTVWGPQGIEAMGCGETVTCTLEPGEGKFVEMKTYPFAE